MFAALFHTFRSLAAFLFSSVFGNFCANFGLCSICGKTLNWTWEPMNWRNEKLTPNINLPFASHKHSHTSHHHWLNITHLTIFEWANERDEWNRAHDRIVACTHDRAELCWAGAVLISRPYGNWNVVHYFVCRMNVSPETTRCKEYWTWWRKKSLTLVFFFPLFFRVLLLWLFLCLS